MEGKAILSLNEQAIDALSYNDHRRAISCLRTAIDQVRSSPELSVMHNHNRGVSSATALLVASVQKDSLQLLPSDDVMIVARPLSILLASSTSQKKLNVFTCLTELDIELLTTTLIFNLGLCMHVHALSSMHNQSKNLQKAMSVYKGGIVNAPTLPINKKEFRPASFKYSLGVVLTAMGNNLASILVSTCQYESLKKIMQWTEAHAVQCCPGLNLSYLVGNSMCWRSTLTKPASAA